MPYLRRVFGHQSHLTDDGRDGPKSIDDEDQGIVMRQSQASTKVDQFSIDQDVEVITMDQDLEVIDWVPETNAGSTCSVADVAVVCTPSRAERVTPSTWDGGSPLLESWEEERTVSPEEPAECSRGELWLEDLEWEASTFVDLEAEEYFASEEYELSLKSVQGLFCSFVAFRFPAATRTDVEQLAAREEYYPEFWKAYADYNGSMKGAPRLSGSRKRVGRRIFDLFAESSGRVSRQELGTVLTWVGLAPSSEELQEALGTAMGSKKDTFSYEAFMSSLTQQFQIRAPYLGSNGPVADPLGFLAELRVVYEKQGRPTP